MNSTTIDSGAPRPAGGYDDGVEPPGVPGGLLSLAFGLVSACRSGAALAMMSERDLDDLGLIPWEVRSDLDGGRAANRRLPAPDPCCIQA